MAHFSGESAWSGIARLGLQSLIISKMADLVKTDSLIAGMCPAGDLPKPLLFLTCNSPDFHTHKHLLNFPSCYANYFHSLVEAKQNLE